MADNRRIFGKISEDWKELHELTVFGFGKVGRGNIEALRSRFLIRNIIDNDSKLCGELYYGISIIAFEQYKIIGRRDKIIVLTSGNRYQSIAAQLKEYGYTEYQDFCDFITFFSDYFWRFKKENFIGRIGLNITTFCTLNCKNCTMHTPYNRYKRNFPYEVVRRDIDLVFCMVDYVSNLLILGGEPFLHQELKEILEYIGGHYRNSIGTIQLITNGTVRASKELLQTIKKYNIEVRISDYTKQVSYGKKLRLFREDIEKYQINYVSYSHDEWLDMGFPEENVNMGNTVQELRQHMFQCSPNCQNVNDGKMYYCAQGWSADQTQLFRLNESDYLDLGTLKNDVDRKEKFRRFYFGEQEDWYFSFCKVCRGWDTDMKVPGGVQYQNGQESEEQQQ